jgi:hypothetical protein
MVAFQFLASKRRAAENHRQLSLLALAGSGDGKKITEQLEAWEND